MERKISVFIGSSSEGLPIAETLKKFLEDEGIIECKVWNDEPQYNKSILTLLTRASYVYDFGVFIACKDDSLFSKDENKFVPRDNVVFEYGLFYGSMGNNRTFLVQEEGAHLPSDLDSYHTPRFQESFNDDDWQRLAESISRQIVVQDKLSDIQPLPSVALAIGYYQSFIKRVARFIYENPNTSCLEKNKTVFRKKKILITIPTGLTDDMNQAAASYYSSIGYDTDAIAFPKRSYSIRYFVQGEEILIGDIPTTLDSLRECIKLLLFDSSLGDSSVKLLAENKELRNFKKALDYLISQNVFTQQLVTTSWAEK